MEGQGDSRGTSPHHIAAAGIVKTFQNPQLFLDLSVYDNVAIASHLRLKRRARPAPVRGAAALARLPRAMRTFRPASIMCSSLCRLDDVRDQLAASLSYGQEKMLGVAMAMMCEPELLLLDEPASGLGEDEIRNLEEVLQDLRAAATTLCIIDHKVDFLGPRRRPRDRVATGNHDRRGTPDEVLRHPRVIEAYLGRQHARA